MDRAESRLVAEQHAKAAGGGPVLSIPLPGGGLKDRDERPWADRIIDRLLSRRRRFDFLEGMLTYSFPSQYPLTRRRTNLTNVMLAKYEELAEVGPMYFEGKEGADELYESYIWLRAISDQVVQRHTTAEWLLLSRRVLFAPFDGYRFPPRPFVESVLRRSRTRSPSKPLRNLHKRKLRVSPSTLEDVHDLFLVTTAMWHIGQSYRTLCKGLVVTISHPITYVGVSYATDPQVVSAIALFEERQAAPTRQRFRTRAGIEGPKFASRPSYGQTVKRSRLGAP
jgi:hypothetical protein